MLLWYHFSRCFSFWINFWCNHFWNVFIFDVPVFGVTYFSLRIETVQKKLVDPLNKTLKPLKTRKGWSINNVTVLGGGVNDFVTTLLIKVPVVKSVTMGGGRGGQKMSKIVWLHLWTNTKRHILKRKGTIQLNV
jgi:hypothetical protein